MPAHALCRGGRFDSSIVTPPKQPPDKATTRIVEHGVAVPSNRLSRLAGFGSMAAGIAGGALTQGAKNLARGEALTLEDLILTPRNAKRMADQLARMRGAAMKVGQLLSMDAGDIIPPEFADILARLRSAGSPMPPRQLKQVLTREWGKGWLHQFERFDINPIAAASIGQVHRARTNDGQELAIKVQYPGIAKSIDSDVDNIGTLINLSGVVPAGVDFAPFLEEAKRQLHEEADYIKEAAHLQRFRDILKDEPDFTLPTLNAELTTQTILAMSYVPGQPIESLIDAPQESRDLVVTKIIILMLRELFEFNMMQTDPNFANYQYDDQTQKIVLLDFGATRSFDDTIVEGYRQLLRAGLAGDTDAIDKAMRVIGYYNETITPFQYQTIMEIMALAMAPLRGDTLYQFGEDDSLTRVRDLSMSLRDERFEHIPPIDTLFVQRKFGGIFLLASKLKARVHVRRLLEQFCR